MKYRFPIVKMLCLAFISQFVFLASGQKFSVRLPTGELDLEPGNNPEVIQRIREEAAYNGRYYFIAKFQRLPSLAQPASLQVHAKLADKTFLVSTTA